MPNNYRIAKVSSLLKKEITLILQNDLENDLLKSNFIHITKIDLTGDLQFCKIYVTSTAEEEIRKEIVEHTYSKSISMVLTHLSKLFEINLKLYFNLRLSADAVYPKLKICFMGKCVDLPPDNHSAKC